MSNDMTYEAAEEILGLPRRYTKEDLRHAYTELARRYHPDAAARHHFDERAAAAHMVEANKAYNLLKGQFAERSRAVVERVEDTREGIAGGYSGIDWRDGAEDMDDADNPWAFAEDWGAEAAPEKVPLSVRSVLLGPVVPRVLMVALLGLIWWRVFPLLPENIAGYLPAGQWSLGDVARLVATMVYPTYFLAYEVLSGYISGFIREVLNGYVSWKTGRYVDLRPHSSSYGCALYKLIREQVYSLLMTPVVLGFASVAVGTESDVVRVLFGVLAAGVGIDALAAVVRGGFINVWTSEVAERVEARYLLRRADLLRHCGQWEN